MRTFIASPGSTPAARPSPVSTATRTSPGSTDACFSRRNNDGENTWSAITKAKGSQPTPSRAASAESPLPSRYRPLRTTVTAMPRRRLTSSTWRSIRSARWPVTTTTSSNPASRAPAKARSTRLIPPTWTSGFGLTLERSREPIPLASTTSRVGCMAGSTSFSADWPA